MTNILNLDDIAQTTDKTITWKGVDYAYSEPSVSAFIEQTRKLEEMEARGPDVSQSEQISFMVDVIAGSFPNLPPDELKKMPRSALNAIVDFIRQDSVTANAPTAAEGEGQGEAQGASS